MPLPLMPDPEEVFVAALAAQPSITAITTHDGATHIGTNWSGSYPAIRVTLVGDSGPENEGSRFVTFQCECVADDDDVASLLARTLESCRLDIRRQTAGGWLALTDVTSVIPGYDEVTERPRYDVTLDGFVGI